MFSRRGDTTGHGRSKCPVGAGSPPLMWSGRAWPPHLAGKAQSRVMHSRIIPVLCLLLVPLAVQAASSEVEARLPVLEPVRVSPYRGEPGEGLKLTFEPLRPNPALALFRSEERRVG